MFRKMGCLCSKLFLWRRPRHEELQEEQPKQFSWDKRREGLRKEDYIIKDQKDATLGRVPGTVNGQQFLVQNCENCNIYVFDHSAAINIDDCVDCNFFLGPIKSSVFIRDCKNCKFIVSCQQFRTRDCNKIDILLCCNTQPIIEASSGMRFGCYQYYYPELADHFKSAGVTVFNNNWGNIHDFTQDPDEQHFSNLPEDAKIDNFLSIPLAEEFSKMKISLDVNDSVVPKTHGNRRKPSNESTLVVFFNDGSCSDRAFSFINAMRSNHSECTLIQTKEVELKPEDAQRVFNVDSYNNIVQQGAVIGMEYNGDDCVETCKTEALNFMKGSAGLIFVSQSQSEAEKQIEDFYNFADMQMAV